MTKELFVTAVQPIQIPMSGPDITDAEIAAVNRVLHSPVLSIGPQIESFEAALESYMGYEQASSPERSEWGSGGGVEAVAVSSGTSGLHLCVIAAGVGEGDIVITTSFSFVAS